MAKHKSFGENVWRTRALNCVEVLTILAVIGVVLCVGYKVVLSVSFSTAMAFNERDEKTSRVLMRVTAASGLNMRTKPSLEGDIVLVLKNGEKVEVLSESSDQWVYIRCIERENKEGYVSAKYLTLVEDDDKGEELAEGTFTDNLESENDVNSYSFEMDEYGDALIYVAGLQEQWDGYTYHWLCSVYQDGSEAVIAQANVRGYTGYYGPTVISVPKLDAGKYCVQMEAASSNNPFMSSFTKAQYSMRIIKYYHSTPLVAYDGNGIQTFHNANDVLWACDGTGFLKLYDGECLAALMMSEKGAIVPVLVGRDEASVEYVISSTGEIVKAKGPWHYKKTDTEYFYSECRYIDQYTQNRVDISSLPMLYIDTNSAIFAIEKILDTQEAIKDVKKEEQYKEEQGEFKYFLKKHSGKLMIGGVIIGLISLVCIKLFKKPSYKSTESSSSYQGKQSYSSGYSTGASSDKRSSQDDDYDMYIMSKIIERSKIYGPDWKGWDPEAPGPDPEASGPDPETRGEIW